MDSLLLTEKRAAALGLFRAVEVPRCAVGGKPVSVTLRQGLQPEEGYQHS